MINSNPPLDSFEEVKCLSDQEVLSQTRQLMQLNRTVTASTLVHVGEMEARGFPPTFESWSWPDEDPSTLLSAARVVRDFPCVLELFQSSEISLSSIAALTSVLTYDERAEVVERLRRSSLAAAAAPPFEPAVPTHSAAPRRYHIAFTVDRGLYEKIKLAADLMSEADEEVPIEDVLTLALENLFDRRAPT